MLKNLLALLLAKFYSKEESGLVARQAMPSDQPVNIASKTTISSWGTIATFTAPGDGYVTFHGRSMAGAAAQIASLPLENNPTVITATQDNYQGMACNLPVQKGKTVEIYGSNIENIVVTFNRLIGGGRKIIRLTLQGGVLCRLSHWYSSLRKNSCKVRKGGLQTNQQFLFKILLNYLLLQMEKVTHLRCRTQGSLTSEVMEFGLPILEGSTLSILGRLRMGTFLFRLTPKKVKNSPTQLGNQTSSLLPIFVYTKSKVTIDLMFGGASC